ncbi:hypothetical protein [uncultured Erythrobacter sp.]|uniref:hypothetical protein n=1 Tax=uncultured Erythrobacter sp. TaxID=263913 RepID=UPI00262ED0A1|nr:hypothetical protein [uncultured Erythrobacter sp.]
MTVRPCDRAVHCADKGKINTKKTALLGVSILALSTASPAPVPALVQSQSAVTQNGSGNTATVTQ